MIDSKIEIYIKFRVRKKCQNFWGAKFLPPFLGFCPLILGPLCHGGPQKCKWVLRTERTRNDLRPDGGKMRMGEKVPRRGAKKIDDAIRHFPRWLPLPNLDSAGVGKTRALATVKRQ